MYKNGLYNNNYIENKMSNYFSVLLIELTNIICFHLTYTETIILTEYINLNLDYQYF